MKKIIISVAMGLFMALAAGSLFASSHEESDGRRSSQAEPHETKINGTIRSVPDGVVGIWNVNGKEINVSRNTRIEEKNGRAEVGAYVEVEVTSSGNSLNAYKIEVKRDIQEVRSIHGTIESIPADSNGIWTVNGQEILVTKDTLLREKDGRAIVGAYVEVEGHTLGDALGEVFSAHKIEVKRATR